LLLPCFENLLLFSSSMDVHFEYYITPPNSYAPIINVPVNSYFLCNFFPSSEIEVYIRSTLLLKIILAG